jgi:hypothetical protein
VVIVDNGRRAARIDAVEAEAEVTEHHAVGHVERLGLLGARGDDPILLLQVAVLSPVTPRRVGREHDLELQIDQGAVWIVAGLCQIGDLVIKRPEFSLATSQHAPQHDDEPQIHGFPSLSEERIPQNVSKRYRAQVHSAAPS